ncbi:hypothetical protein P8452_42854 [Trifolium repens]|nr:hypothetical protein P8452_42854 [Trifolium repens]
MNHNLRFFFEDFITKNKKKTKTIVEKCWDWELSHSMCHDLEEGATNDDGQSYNSEYLKEDEDDIDDMPYKVLHPGKLYLTCTRGLFVVYSWLQLEARKVMPEQFQC